MEHFKGSLAHYRLELVMPALFASAQLEGTLRVERGAVQRHFFLKGGHLVGESSSVPTEHLGQVLVNLRVLEATRAAAAFEAAESAAVPFGTFLVQRCYLDEMELVEAMEHKAREALFDCYTWQSGEVEFTPGLPPLDKAVGLKLPLAVLHRDAVARVREWHQFREFFPRLDVTFRVFREFGLESYSEEEEVLLELAEDGATLGELLAAARETPLYVARWVLHLYRRGALTPCERQGPGVGESTGLQEMLELARRFMDLGQYEHAVALAEQVLERGPVPEAHALYRDAEVRLALSLWDELVALDGQLVFEPMHRPAPPSLTADDLYLYSKLRSGRSLRGTLRSAAMGELAASRSVRRLMDAGLVRVLAHPGARPPERHTVPYGLPELGL